MIYGTANVSSVKTNNSTRDKHLQNEDWFYSEKYPQIVVQSKKIIKQQNGTYIGTFDVKIKGKSQTLYIPFQVTINAGEKSLKANFVLSISTFDIGGGIVSYLVGDKVNLNLNLPF